MVCPVWLKFKSWTYFEEEIGIKRGRSNRKCYNWSAKNTFDVSSIRDYYFYVGIQVW